MNGPLTRDVSRQAAGVAAAARDGGAWMQGGAIPEGPAGERVLQNFRRFARRASRLQCAAARRTCVAVFGACAVARTIKDNARDSSSGTIDIERNGRLGQILQQLRVAA